MNDFFANMSLCEIVMIIVTECKYLLVTKNAHCKKM